MADNTSERNVNIESTVNVGTASGKTTVSGTKVSVGSARDVHVHGDTTAPPSFRSVVLVGVLGFLGAVLVNIATSQLPPGLQPYLWLAWPLALLVTGGSIWVAYLQSRRTNGTILLGSSLAQRNRRVMLTKVKTIWIDGLLEQSLAKELRIALDLTEQLDAVELPLNALVQELNRPSHSLPAGTSIINVFDQMNGTLLILGAPGAGKTTLLLELARDLIARAEQDEEHPIPVVFNLSSWAEKRLSLDKWLIEELNLRYDVPRKVAEAWIDFDAVLPLLDGLDEVKQESRGACVEAINAFRPHHGLVNLAVCSRMADYDALTTKLRLQGAILVQPLTQQQIDSFLASAGDQLVTLRTALTVDAVLRELAESPLMLSIMVLAYRRTTIDVLKTSGTIEEQRNYLFAVYVKRMFQRRGAETCYNRRQTIHWLGWLAWAMQRHSQTVLHIEAIQPGWLLLRRQQWLMGFVTVVVLVLCGGLVGGLVGGVVGVLSGELVDKLLVGIYLGTALGMFIGSILSVGASDDIDLVEIVQWSWSTVRQMLIVGLRAVLVFGSILGLIGGLLGGVGVALMAVGVTGSAVTDETIPRAVRFVLQLLVLGVVAGLVVGLLFGIGITQEEVKIPPRIIPNAGIRRSIYNGLVYGLISGIGVGSILGLVDGPDFGIGGALFSGLLVGLFTGGRAAVQHIALRFALVASHLAPLDYASFLDEASDRLLLRRVGGGYIFVHRLLMEHFASLYTESDQPAALPSDGAVD